MRISYAAVILSFVAMLSPVRADFMVHWGENPSGVNTPGTNIVNGNQSFGVLNATTYSGLTNNPAVGASYYPNSTDRSPYFSAASSAVGTRLVEQANSGDRLTLYQGGAAVGATYRGMVMWQSNAMLTAGTSMTLTNFSLIINQRLNAATVNQGLRFVVQQGGSYFISDAHGFGANNTTQSYSLASMTWNDFTPFVSGVETIGAAALAPSFDNVQSVGYYFTVENGGGAAAQIGAQVQYFAAEGMVAVVPEPSTMALMGVVGGLLVWRRRRMSNE